MKEWIYKLLGSLMTDEEKELQRRSFVYGNTKLHNPDITREIVNEVAERRDLIPNLRNGNGEEMSKWNYDKPILPHENEITKQRRQEDIDQMLEVLGMTKRKQEILAIGGFSFDCEIEEHSKKERRILGYPVLDMLGLDANKPIIQQDGEIKYAATMRNTQLNRKHIADLKDLIVAFGPTSKHGVCTGVITNVEYSTEEIIIEYMPDTQPQSKIWQE